ncbi:MAG: lysophospholipase [Elusimicrobiota bacterium]
MLHSEKLFKGFQGIGLFSQQWLAASPIKKGNILAIHGLGEHSGRFTLAGEYFSQRGWSFYSYDLRGHGRSQGQRGYVDSWEVFRKDFEIFRKEIVLDEGPFFLTGHSLGGVIATDLSVHFPKLIKGLILESPAFEPNIPSSFWVLAKFFNVIFPRFSRKLPLKPINKINSTFDEKPKDPLNHSKASARLGVEFKKTVEEIYENASKLLMPVILFHGHNDHLVSEQVSRDFLSTIGSQDKNLYEYENGDHELFEAELAEECFVKIENWLNPRNGE